MKVYKVVRRRFGISSGLYSVIMFNHACVKYEPNKWVEAPEWLQERGYHLTAFEDLKVAEKWTNEILRLNADLPLFLEIWEAEADGVVEDLPPKCNEFAVDYEKLLPRLGVWPEGTVMCRRLKLVKKVE